MADRYWVWGWSSSNWGATSPTNWAWLSEVTDLHWVSMWAWGWGITWKVWQKIIANIDCTLKEILFDALHQCNTAYLCDSALNVLASNSITARVATFNYALTSWVTYYVLWWVASWWVRRPRLWWTAWFPIVRTNINFTAAYWYWTLLWEVSWVKTEVLVSWASVPTSSDDVFFDWVWAGASDCNILWTTNACRNIDFTWYNNTLTHNTSTRLSIYWNAVFSNTMIYNPNLSSQMWIRWTCDFYPADKTFWNISLFVWTMTLKWDLVLNASSTLSLESTFDASDWWNNRNVLVWWISALSASSLIMWDGIREIYWNQTRTCLINSWTINAWNSTIKITWSLTWNKNLSFQSKVYNNIWIAHTWAYSINIVWNNTFNDFKIEDWRIVWFTWWSTQTISSFTPLWILWSLVTLQSTNTTSRNISSLNEFSWDYLNISRSNAIWWPRYVWDNSIDWWDNTGWIFPVPPSLFIPQIVIN